MKISSNPKVQKLNILVELRPALDGYAGIPQETRLLFSSLAGDKNLNVEGLIQSTMYFLPKTPKHMDPGIESHVYINANSKLILAIERINNTFKLNDFLKRRWIELKHVIKSPNSNIIISTQFNPKGFEDFVWRKFFSKSLPPSLFQCVTSRQMQVISIPWSVLHMIGLWTKRFFGSSQYPKISISEIDIFIAQTPYPGKLINNTKLVVRYHDAVPIFLPHTIGNMDKHQANHYEALKSNVADGAYFACVSDSSRKDLLRIFPEVESRAVTIENMVSHHYFIESSNTDYAKRIIQNRQSSSLASQLADFGIESKYVLMVSTIEPRKNHELLLNAWESLKIQHKVHIKLVLVGNLGWGSEELLKRMRPWIESGSLILLSGVPADELRVLYRNASLVICPSVAEGFDYSGIEAICSGAIVLASDIAVHKEIYGVAAEYFATYDSNDLMKKINELLSDESSVIGKRAEKFDAGRAISYKYKPDFLLPRWKALINQIVAD
jgi:glycosyltransferase involved in cell wall biosynthesis